MPRPVKAFLAMPAWVRSTVLLFGFAATAAMGQTGIDIATGSKTIQRVAETSGVLGLLCLAIIAMMLWVWWATSLTFRLLERSVRNHSESLRVQDGATKALTELVDVLRTRPCLIHGHDDHRDPMTPLTKIAKKVTDIPTPNPLTPITENEK